MDEREFQARRAEFEAQAIASVESNVIGSSAPGDVGAAVGEVLRRMGVPVVRTRVQGDAVIADVAAPRGHG